MGALIAGVDSELIDSLEKFGRHLGTALVINSELNQLEAVGSKNQRADEDLMNKKKSLPVVMAFENATPSGRRKLGDYYFKRVLEPDDLPGLAALVNELGGTESATRVLKNEMVLAVEALDSAGLNSEGKTLLADYVSLMMGTSVAD